MFFNNTPVMFETKIAYIGLGKLGLPLSVLFGKNKTKVIAVDTDKELIDKLDDCEIPYVENNLKEYFDVSKDNIRFTNSYENIIDETDISVILVNTQIGDGYSSIVVENVIDSLCYELKKSSKKYHLFILSSTVMPGDIKTKLIPKIEKITNRKLNEGFIWNLIN